MTGRPGDDMAKDQKGWHMPRNRQEWKAEALDWLKTIVVVLAIFLPTNTFVVQGYRIPSSSMENTLLIGDFLFADKFTYGARLPFADGVRLPGFRDPEADDIVIFKSPLTGETLIKRCVAVAGQRVEMRDKVLFIDGERQDEPYVKFIRAIPSPQIDNMASFEVPEGHIFCLGDNRDASADGRYFGPVDLKLVIAKADVLYFSIDWDRMLPRINRIGKML